MQKLLKKFRLIFRPTKKQEAEIPKTPSFDFFETPEQLNVYFLRTYPQFNAFNPFFPTDSRFEKRSWTDAIKSINIYLIPAWKSKTEIHVSPLVLSFRIFRRDDGIDQMAVIWTDSAFDGWHPNHNSYKGIEESFVHYFKDLFQLDNIAYHHVVGRSWGALKDQGRRLFIDIDSCTEQETLKVEYIAYKNTSCLVLSHE